MKQLAESISTNDAGEILENIHAMVALVENDGTLVSWNRAFDSYRKLFPTASKLEDYFSPQDREQIASKLNSKTKEHWIIKIHLPAGREELAVQCECLLLPTENGRSLFIAEEIHLDSAFQDILERLNKQVKLFQIESEVTKKLARNKQIEMEGIMIQAREVAETDPLTFLPNRRIIIKELQDEVLRAERYNNQLSISIVDVDHFKIINDTHGHPAGDEVLKQIAHQLRDHIRHPDIVGRYGGEEFLIILPNSDSIAAAEQAMRLCNLVRETAISINKGEQELKVTISIGVAQFQHGADTWDTLLNRADNAMYEAKSNGRDQWVVAQKSA